MYTHLHINWMKGWGHPLVSGEASLGTNWRHSCLLTPTAVRCSDLLQMQVQDFPHSLIKGSVQSSILFTCPFFSFRRIVHILTHDCHLHMPELLTLPPNPTLSYLDTWFLLPNFLGTLCLGLTELRRWRQRCSCFTVVLVSGVIGSQSP